MYHPCALACGKNQKIITTLAPARDNKKIFHFPMDLHSFLLYLLEYENVLDLFCAHQDTISGLFPSFSVGWMARVQSPSMSALCSVIRTSKMFISYVCAHNKMYPQEPCPDVIIIGREWKRVEKRQI